MLTGIHLIFCYLTSKKYNKTDVLKWWLDFLDEKPPVGTICPLIIFEDFYKGCKEITFVG